ncbi:MAG: helix-turn-helix domain-containing protein [Pseudomonadota bacterium]
MIDIAELARRSGLRASTIRYYEERGLIQSIGRRGLRRTFDEAVMDRLALIALGRAAGFSLDDIGEMFAKGPGFEIDRGRLLERADQLDTQIKKLTLIRDGLRHTVNCPAPRHIECPTFQRMMRAAGHGLIPALEQPTRRASSS